MRPWLVVIIAFVYSLPSNAASLDPQSFAAATNEIIAEIGAFVGLGADLHAYEASKPNGELLGLDVGLSATAISLPPKVVRGLTDLGIPDVPHYLPLPKLNIHKPLHRRVFVGSEFLPSIKVNGSRLSLYGFDFQWTILDRPRVPPVALRGQFNYADFVFVQAATYGGDVVSTLSLLVVDFYAGAGYRYVRAKISNPTKTVPVLPGLKFDTVTDAGHFLAGISIKLAPMRLTTEANFTTRGVHTYGAKIGFFF